MVKYVTPLYGMRVFDIGCNAGLYMLRMVDKDMHEVISLYLNPSQAEFMKYWYAIQIGRDYSSVSFIQADVTGYDLRRLG